MKINTDFLNHGMV